MIDRSLPFFVRAAREWRAIADTLREAGIPADDPALGVWREAAWCHLLFRAGKCAAAVGRLRVVFRDVTGSSPPAPHPHCGDRTVALAAAAELFVGMKKALNMRYATVA
jgi:hypothetical protein